MLKVLPARVQLTVLGLLAQALLPTGAAVAQLDFEHPPIAYSTTPVNDPVEHLRRAIDAGDVTLERDRRLGWLPAVLDQLGISESSQTLVFSKTSLQRRLISPSRPRALYFSDEVYVGYVRFGRQLEIAAVDPHQGAVFYTINQRDREQPVIKRDGSRCMSCHASRRTKGVPGFLVRSVFVDEHGELDSRLGDGLVTDHTTPLADRFGGWYVTGNPGGAPHRGNAINNGEASPVDGAPVDGPSVDGSSVDGPPVEGRQPSASRSTLDELVDTAPYPQPGSDLIALMVLEHQSQVHNLITRAGYQTRIGAHYDEAFNKMTERPAGTQSDSTQRRITRACEELLQHLLFSDEAELRGPIAGSSTFAADFQALGPRDSRGRSLRDLDLQTRLFRYPCSFLIYSPSIDALPQAARDRLRRRLTEVLSGEDQSPEFAHLTADDRRAILEILRETKPERLEL